MTMRNTHYFFEILFTLFLAGTFSSYAQSSCYKTEYGVENEWITGTILTVITTVRFI